MIVRPCVVFGPGVDNFISRFTTRPVVPLISGTDPPMQLVHEDDAARAIWFLKTRPSGLRSEPTAPEAFNLAADGLLRYDEAFAALGGRVVRLPAGVAKVITAAAWTLRLHALTEAPPGMLEFIRYRWCIANEKLRLGFEYRHDARATLEAFAAARKNRARH